MRDMSVVREITAEELDMVVGGTIFSDAIANAEIQAMSTLAALQNSMIQQAIQNVGFK